ncbi:MAG: PepSY domain-containing protein [Sphingobacteriaceae bacterium]|nr:PepSY domain-containing protein [Sphingobacteriaceae bacterium]
MNPYTGEITGTIHQDNSFLGTVLQLHRGLLLGEVGKKITGVSAFVFLFMIISGIILWWPKGKFSKQKFNLKKGASLKRLNYDMHSVLGFYASWVLIFSVVTGLIWSFKWVENSMYAMVGSKKEKKQYHSTYSDSTTFSLEKTISFCKQEFPEHKEIFITLPEDSAGTYRFNLRNNHSDGFFKDQHQLFFDQYSGNIVKKQLFADAQKGDKLKALNYDIHTGKIFGLTGQFIVFFSALIAASLPITGFIMWRNKRRSKQTFFKD